jgi:O-succinylbenzoate synthase
MKIEKVTLREISMRLKAPFETSFGVTQDRRVVLVEVVTDAARGWAECTAGEGPFYNPETTDTSWMILRDFLIPLVVGKSFDSLEALAEDMHKVRGHEMAKATIENAAWDAQAQAQKTPLHVLLGGTQDNLPSGVSLGIHHDTGALLDKIATELESGYRRIKLKIKPGKDVAVVRAVRKAYPDIALTVDANSAYGLEDADLLKQLDEFGLTYIEQPLEWNEIYRHAALQKQLTTAICLDECIHNQDYCQSKGVPVWCGGMLESGIGRAHNIAMSSLPGFVLPGDVSASQRYWSEDIIEPEVTVTPQGTITVPTEPGIGFAIRRDLIEKLTVRSEEFRPA